MSTEIYDGESLEVTHAKDVKFIEKPQMEIASKLVWTTPKVITTDMKKPVISKETVSASMEVIPSKGSDDTNWDLEVSEYERNSTRLNNTMPNSYNESNGGSLKI